MSIFESQFARIIIVLVICLSWIWGVLALFYTKNNSPVSHYLFITLFIFSLPVAYIITNSFNKTAIISLLIFAIFQVWWSSLAPSNQKIWAKDIEKIPFTEIKNEQLTIHNVRNFRYRSENDFDSQWETRRYDLSKLQSLDIFISYWGSPHIAHTIMSWGFENGDYLAISIEARKTESQSYSAVQGFFKQFNLAYVVADERDLIRLRTNFRKEDVYLYRLNNTSIENARKLLESYTDHMNQLAKTPVFYHALTLNCTSAIVLHSEAINPDSQPFDWRLTVNGHLDELLYERHNIDNSVSFDELKQRNHINKRATEASYEDFSAAIRSHSGE